MADCAWRWLWTDWSPSIFSWIGTIRLFLFFNMKKTITTWLRSSIGLIMRSYLQLRTLLRIRMRASVPQDSKHCNTACWKKCVNCRGDYVEKLTKFGQMVDHCIIVGLWTFQPNFIHTWMMKAGKVLAPYLKLLWSFKCMYHTQVISCNWSL